MALTKETPLTDNERIADENTSSGKYARRASRSRWHIVESWIAGDAVTKCGRRLDYEPNDYGSVVVSDTVGEFGSECRVCGEASLADPA
jgi:hypothetical protein